MTFVCGTTTANMVRAIGADNLSRWYWKSYHLLSLLLFLLLLWCVHCTMQVWTEEAVMADSCDSYTIPIRSLKRIFWNLFLKALLLHEVSGFGDVDLMTAYLAVAFNTPLSRFRSRQEVLLFQAPFSSWPAAKTTYGPLSSVQNCSIISHVKDVLLGIFSNGFCFHLPEIRMYLPASVVDRYLLSWYYIMCPDKVYALSKINKPSFIQIP